MQLNLFGDTTAPAQYDDMPLPQPEKGEERKRVGMARAAASKESQLGYARGLAMDLARANGGLCHADMVAEALAKEGRAPLGDAAGSLWLKHVWEFSGQYHLSERPASHRNRLMVWRLKHG